MVTVVQAYLKSINYLLTKNIFKYVIYTVLLSIGVSIIFGGLIYNFSDDAYHFLERKAGFDVTNSFFDGFLSFLSGLLLFALFMLIFKYLVLILASPLLGPLSEKIESMETGDKVSIPFTWKTMSQSMTRSIRIASRLFFKEMLFTIPLFLLSFVPIVGLVAVALIFIVQSYYAGVGAIDCYQDRNRNVKETIAFARKNKLSMIALGAGFVGMLLIPIAGVLFAPILSTMAGTILGLKIDAKSQIL